eukprot:487850-Pelagomonas_calceolata.AAC.1
MDSAVLRVRMLVHLAHRLMSWACATECTAATMSRLSTGLGRTGQDTSDEMSAVLGLHRPFVWGRGVGEGQGLANSVVSKARWLFCGSGNSTEGQQMQLGLCTSTGAVGAEICVVNQCSWPPLASNAECHGSPPGVAVHLRDGGLTGLVIWDENDHNYASYGSSGLKDCYSL